jgi:hypothetical protein
VWLANGQKFLSFEDSSTYLGRVSIFLFISFFIKAAPTYDVLAAPPITSQPIQIKSRGMNDFGRSRYFLSIRLSAHLAPKFSEAPLRVVASLLADARFAHRYKRLRRSQRCTRTPSGRQQEFNSPRLGKIYIV